MKSDLEEIKTLVLDIFLKSESPILSIETVHGNELMQRLLDTVAEFEVKYENK